MSHAADVGVVFAAAFCVNAHPTYARISPRMTRADWCSRRSSRRGRRFSPATRLRSRVASASGVPCTPRVVRQKVRRRVAARELRSLRSTAREKCLLTWSLSRARRWRRARARSVSRASSRVRATRDHLGDHRVVVTEKSRSVFERVVDAHAGVPVPQRAKRAGLHGRKLRAHSRRTAAPRWRGRGI